jgi:hypothetical protein
MDAGCAVAKRKSGDDLKLGVVKIERAIISRARMIAADRGIALAGYLSDSLRVTVDKDWNAMVRRASQSDVDARGR